MDLCLRNGRKDLLGQGGADILFHRNLQELMAPLREWTLSLLAGKTKQDLQRLWKTELQQKVLIKLNALNNFSQPRSKFLLDYLTVADFELAYLIEIYDFISAETGLENPFASYGNIYQIRENVMSLEGVSAHVQSQEYKEMLFAPPGATKFMRQENEQGGNNGGQGM
jgi:hypothetical protein